MNKAIIIPENTPVIDVLQKFDNDDSFIYVLSRDSDALAGYITDGVLRSLALDTSNLHRPVGEFTLNNFYVIDKQDKAYAGVDIGGYSLIIERHGQNLGRVFGPVMQAYETVDVSDVPVVIMAGGQGKRLRPVTNIIPKPLLPVGNKAVLEIIINRFFEYGIKDFILTLNYKANFIKSYFAELRPPYSLQFIEENKPLGTAGALRFLLDQVDKPFFVSNCDTLINTSYKKLYDFHLRHKFDLTIVGAVQKIQIPFGICEVDNDFSLIQMKEKPATYHIINTGVYIVNPGILDIIPPGKFYDITDFIRDIQKVGGEIGVYPIAQNSWINLGSLNDFQKNMDKLL